MTDVAPEAAQKAGEGFKGVMLTRLGPLKLWQILALLGVMIVGVILYRRRKTPSSSAASPTSGDVSGSDDPAQTGDSTASQSGSATLTGDTAGTGSTITNAQWAVTAANNLIGQGQDPSVVQSALSDYLNGAVLSPAEQTLVNSALQQSGTPPQGVVAVSTATQTKPYMVRGDESLVYIAHALYGDGSKWTEIYNANKAAIGPDPGAVRAGMTLNIPTAGLLPKPTVDVQGGRTKPANHLYTVQFGDTLTGLSWKFYADAKHADTIYRANPTRIPNKLELSPGVTLRIP